ncbi:hypothetical protein TEA_026682 [Camellia sinensis var. sinensis]|uniref:BZIP domain-containing protein n=2 Tax=Camellia sinensis TaxID=4442 RepID=A0A4S4E5N8_CAMSN|nr:hypothetical protein TEA_026682 [Camellia sinensis var. sinensis]
MVPSSSRNSDRTSSSASSKSSSIISELQNHNNHQQLTKNSNNLGSMTVDSSLIDAEITLLDAAGAVTAISDNEYNGGGRGGGTPMIRSNFVAKKTVGDVWKEIVAGRRELRECKKEAPDEVTTLEEFPAKAEVVVEDVKVRLVPPLGERLSGGFLAFDPMPLSRFPSQQSVDSFEGFGNGVEVIGGRGKRRAVLELLDRAAQQRQRRMIKNRESAARST